MADVDNAAVIEAIEVRYRALAGLSQEQFLMSGQGEFFRTALGELLDEEEEVLFWDFLGLENVDWLVVLIEDEIRLLHVDERKAELRCLGRLRGKYVERIEERDGQAYLILSQDGDDRLPGNKLQLEAALHGHAASRLEPLRQRLRQWSAYDERA
jgi:hypothetical protein